ncbi:unnamed protein product [Chrysoparadoxa australica]
MELTDELDPYFLHTLQVGEEDYHQLKQDQRLRVDFQSFPQQFIQLLEGCQTEGGSEGQFVARLETPGTGLGTFSVVETNHFKDLTHLSLQFRPGNDAAIKSYLAARLRQLKGEKSALAQRLTMCEAALADGNHKLEAATEELSLLRANRERDLRDLKAAQAGELASVREGGLQRLEAATAAHGSELEKMRSSHQEAEAALSEKLGECTAERDELKKLNYNQEGELKELRMRADQAEQAAKREEEAASMLRLDIKKQEVLLFEAEKGLQRAQMEGAALQQKVEDTNAVLERAEALRAAAEGNVAKSAETLAAYKKNVVTLQEKLESSVAEITRGNSIIQRLQGEYRALRSKAHLKSQVIRQQERVVQEQRDVLGAGEAKVLTAHGDAKAAKAKAEALSRELAVAEAKLAESAKLLASNQQVISWLNKELNEAHSLAGVGMGQPFLSEAAEGRPQGPHQMACPSELHMFHHTV